MASNHKKSNGGRKTTAGNTHTAPRHHAMTNNTRATPNASKANSPTPGARHSGSASTFERKPTDLTRQQIAEAAYFLWQKRGGTDESNWLEAERLLKAGLPVR